MRIVAQGVNAMRSPERAILVVTHYQRLLNYIVPDYVHVLVDGRIVRSGGPNWRSNSKKRLRDESSARSASATPAERRAIDTGSSK